MAEWVKTSWLKLKHETLRDKGQAIEKKYFTHLNAFSWKQFHLLFEMLSKMVLCNSCKPIPNNFHLSLNLTVNLFEISPDKLLSTFLVQKHESK